MSSYYKSCIQKDVMAYPPVISDDVFIWRSVRYCVMHELVSIDRLLFCI
jgi:hypothetical protein